MDFKDGIIFCELISTFKHKLLDGVIKTFPATLETSLRNITLALNELKELTNVPLPTPNSIYNNEDVMFDLLEIIKNTFNQHKEEGKRSERLEVKKRNNKDSLKLSNFKRLNNTWKPPSTETEVINSLIQGISVNEGNYFNFPKPTEPLSISLRSTKLLRRKKAIIKIIEDTERMNVKDKKKILNWLEEIKLIKPGVVTIEAFPYYCRNGVLLADLITRIEGSRGKHIQGIIRNPKTTQSILLNLKMCLRRLQTYERFNSKYLWSEKAIMEGDQNVIWELLKDIWNLAHRKVTSTNNVKVKETTSSIRTMKRRSLPESLIRTEKNSPQSNQFGTTKTLMLSSTQSITPTNNEREARNWLRYLRAPLETAGSVLNNPYQNGDILLFLLENLENIKPINYPLHKAEDKIKYALNVFKKKQPYKIPSHFFTKETIQRIIEGDNKTIWDLISKLKELYSPSKLYNDNIMTWLKNLGVINSNIENEIRSGVLFCALAEVLTGENVKPLTANYAMNVKKAFEALKHLKDIDLNLEKEILKGDHKAIRMLLKLLYDYHNTHKKEHVLTNYIPSPITPNESSNALRNTFNSALKKREESIKRPNTNTQKTKSKPILSINNSSLQSPLCNTFRFTRDEDIIPKLSTKHSLSCNDELLEWLQTLGVVLPTKFSFDRPILHEFKDGILLCQIIGILEGQVIKDVISNPKSYASAIKNIRKALKILKKRMSIPQHYLNAEESIYKGDQKIIIGLLRSVKKVYNYLGVIDTVQRRQVTSTRNLRAPFGIKGTMKSINNSLLVRDRKQFSIPAT